MADVTFTRRLVKKILAKGAVRVRRQIPSKTLRKSLRRVTISPLEGVLFIPHYWAVYVHDGRRGFGAKPGSFLIFWRNPAEDPRFPGRQTPERATQVRKLSASEFKEALEEFQSGSGRVVITRRVRGVSPTPFFSNAPGGGMFGFVRDANGVGQFEFRTFALGFLKRPLGIRGFIPQLGVGGASVNPVRDKAVLRI